MQCPTCGYLMEQTDLECPRCKLMAAKTITPPMQKPIQQKPAQGTTPQNPVYVQDPYVHIIAKANVESTVAGVYFAVRLIAFFMGCFAGSCAFVIFSMIFSGINPSILDVLWPVIFIGCIVVIYFATKWSYKLLMH